MDNAPCSHIAAVEKVRLPERLDCDECVKTGGMSDDAFLEY